MKPNVAARREEQLQQMRKAASAFYELASESGCDQFVEFTGLLNRYINLAEQLHRKGIDFLQTEDLDIEDFEAASIAQQFSDVFGESFRSNPNSWNIFQDIVLQIPPQLVAVG